MVMGSGSRQQWDRADRPGPATDRLRTRRRRAPTIHPRAWAAWQRPATGAYVNCSDAGWLRHPLGGRGNLLRRLRAGIGQAAGAQAVDDAYMHVMVAQDLAGEANGAEQFPLREAVVLGDGHPVRLTGDELHPAGGTAGIAAAAVQDVDAVALDGSHQPHHRLRLKGAMSLDFNPWHCSPYLLARLADNPVVCMVPP